MATAVDPAPNVDLTDIVSGGCFTPNGFTQSLASDPGAVQIAVTPG
jgi:hypothetical protein